MTRNLILVCRRQFFKNCDSKKPVSLIKQKVENNRFSEYMLQGKVAIVVQIKREKLQKYFVVHQ